MSLAVLPLVLARLAAAAPNPAPLAPPGLEKFANDLFGWLKWTGWPAAPA